MRKVLLLVLVAAGVLATAASAITTNGFPDNGRHPNVGAILIPTRDGTGWAEVCSGTLVSDRYFLTASHCTAFLEADPRPEYVTFDESDGGGRPDGPDPRNGDHEPRVQGQRRTATTCR